MTHLLCWSSLFSVGVLHAVLLLALIPLISGESEFVHPGLVLLVDVSLVEENEEDDVISEAAKSVHGWHLDDECKDVVNEGVESFVGHHPPVKQINMILGNNVDEIINTRAGGPPTSACS